MKKYLTLFFTLPLSISAFAQNVTSHNLDLNQVNAVVNDGGVFFNDEQNGAPGYEIEQGSQLHPIYALGFWFGGVDVNGQLKLSAQRYENLKDQFKGPLTINGAALAPPAGTWTDAIFPVTKSEIDDHIANYASSGYVVPASIANWPAHGDIALGQDYYLAPFVDVDGDGSYDPLVGDHPCIRGDHAAFVIMNDKGGIHMSSGGDPIGIEMHYMFYEYTGIPEIENTTFINLKLINRGTQTLNDFKVSAFLDGDIGNFDDDYFGSDSSRNLMYFYNGDNFDQGGIGSNGYSAAPPAAGLVSLDADFQSIGSFATIANTAAQFWNLMSGKDLSGAPWMNSTGTPVNYVFASDPSSTTDTDSEAALGIAPGDRRGVANIDLGTLTPFSQHIFDFAVIYNRDTVSNLDNASGLLSVADVVQDFFDSTINDECSFTTVSIPENPETEFSIFPNPSHGDFTISLEADFSDAQVEIIDITGRTVLDQLQLSSKETAIQLNQPSGVYLLQLTIDGNSTVKRIIVE